MGTNNLPPIAPDGLRHWFVASGVIVAADRILLVENRRRGGRIEWSPPGGVVEAGEAATAGLSREFKEETGLVVDQWLGPIYRVEVVAPQRGFHLWVEAFAATDPGGELVIDDPDGIVSHAEWVDVTAVSERLDPSIPWIVEPLLAHLIEGVDDGRLFAYQV